MKPRIYLEVCGYAIDQPYSRLIWPGECVECGKPLGEFQSSEYCDSCREFDTWGEHSEALGGAEREGQK